MSRESGPAAQATSYSFSKFWFFWLSAVLLGLVLALTKAPMSILPYGIAPLGNDAFYHAARIMTLEGGARLVLRSTHGAIRVSGR